MAGKTPDSPPAPEAGSDDPGKAAGGETAPDFHGAAIIDDDGNEIPITETMIKEACKQLDPEASATADDKTR